MTSTFAGLAPLLAQQPGMWDNPLTGLIVSLSWVISGIGILLIAWGAYSSVLRLIESETAAARGQAPKADTMTGGFVFSTYLLPSLDFLMAGSVIKAVGVQDWQQAILVASLVFARTLVGLGLKWGVPSPVGLTPVPAVTEQLGAPLASPNSLNASTATPDLAAVTAHTAQ